MITIQDVKEISKGRRKAHLKTVVSLEVHRHKGDEWTVRRIRFNSLGADGAWEFEGWVAPEGAEDEGIPTEAEVVKTLQAIDAIVAKLPD